MLPSGSRQEPEQRPEVEPDLTHVRPRIPQGAQNTYAMLTTFNEVDMSQLMALRNDFKDAFVEKHGVKLGFMSAFIKARPHGGRIPGDRPRTLLPRSLAANPMLSEMGRGKRPRPLAQRARMSGSSPVGLGGRPEADPCGQRRD